MVLAVDMDDYEKSTIDRLKARGELTDGNWQGLAVSDYTPKDRDDYYYRAKHKKSKLVLHYTMGYLTGDLAKLTKNNFHVSVPFVVARSGMIIRLFDPDYWSHHVGPGALGGNKTISKASVAIELSCLGPLVRDDGWINNYYGSKFCKHGETELYIDLGKEYRDYRYYARFADAQYKAAQTLIQKIVNHYGITKTFMHENARYDLFASSAMAKAYKGICSHVNFRPSGEKTDIGPAFDWKTIGAKKDGSVDW